MSRGRTRSVTSHAVPLIPGTRMPPPETLSSAQAATWNEVVRALPQGWIRRENAALLVAWCRHCDYSDQLAGDIEQARAEVAAAADLNAARRARSALFSALRAHKLQTDTIARLSQKLRLSQLSRYTRDAEGAAIAARSASTVPDPWNDWRGGKQ
jgi:hypothetical protein